MSAAGSVQQQLTQVTVFDALGLNGYSMFVTGGVFHTTPTLASDGEAQSLNVNEAGGLRVSGPVPDNVVLPAYADPVWIGGQHNTALPTYDDGDVASMQMDLNGRHLTRAMGYDADNAAASATTSPVRVGGNFNLALPTYGDGDQVTDQHDLNGRKLIRSMGFDNDNAAATASNSPHRVGGNFNLALPTYDDGDQVTDQHDASGRKLVVASGVAADNAAVVGNPVLIAFRFDTVLPTYDDGDVATPHTDANGRVLVREDTLDRGAGAVSADTIRVTMATDTVSQVQGQAADNAAALDNPVLVGGEYNAAAPTYDDGDVANLQVDIRGRQRVVKETPVAQTIVNAQITVGVAPAIRMTTDGAVPGVRRSLLHARPDAASAARFFYGASGVLISTGIEFFPGELLEFLDDAADYFMVSDTAGQTIGIVEKE